MDLNSSFLFANGHNTVTFTLNCLQVAVSKLPFASKTRLHVKPFICKGGVVTGQEMVREKLFKVKEKLTF